MEFPIYELKINEEQQDDAEVSYIALVDLPAIKKDFLAFKQDFIEPTKVEEEKDFMPRCISYVINEGKDQDQAVAICSSIWDNRFKETKNLFSRFQVISEDEHIISGPLMLADELIYRNNDKFGEHYVKFSADTIKAIAIKFSKKKYQSNVNLMHDPNQKVHGVTMFESFLTDKKRGIMPMAGYQDVSDGSWFGSFYVENPEVWNAIKTGEYRGFSVEGLFDYVEPKSQDDKLLARLTEILNSF